MTQENSRSVTLKVAIFFGLTTFTLCIAIFYTESVLEESKELLVQKDSVIDQLHLQLENQQAIILGLEKEAKSLSLELKVAREIQPSSTSH